MVAEAILMLWAGGLAFGDWRSRRISNALLAVGLAFGLAHWLATGSMPLGPTLAQGAAAAAFGLGATLPLYLAGWMGAGDVKACAVIGWIGGLPALLASFLAGSLIAGVLALALLFPAGRRWLSGSGLEPRLQQRVPFGIALALALIALAAGWLDADLFLLPGERL